MLTRSGTSTRQVVRFRSSGQNYLLDLDEVRSVQRGERIIWKEGPYGQVGWLGTSHDVPVYSVATALGGPPTEDFSRSAALVLGSAKQPYGLAVERVLGAARLEIAQMAELPPPLRRTHGGMIRGVLCGHDSDDIALYLASDFLIGPSSQPPQEPPFKVPTAPPRSIERSRVGRSLVVFQPLNQAAPDLSPQLAVSMSQVREILEPRKLHVVPGAPEPVLGLIGWRGQAVPVLDFGRTLGLSPIARQEWPRLIILRGAANSAVCAIPSGEDIRRANLPIAHQPLSREAKIHLKFAKGAFQAWDRPLVVPDIDACLAA